MAIANTYTRMFFGGSLFKVGTNNTFKLRCACMYA